MSTLHAIALGIVQGLTEFLPVSSSGHLILVPWLFGWDDFAGNDSLAKAFDVSLHIGTLAGALVYFRSDVRRYAVAGVGAARTRRLDGDGRIAWLLVLSAIPAAITGALLDDVIEQLDDEIWLIAVMLIVFGGVLLWADRTSPGDRDTSTWSVRDAAAMGIGQALALQPGVSRSGVTITVARRMGLSREAATRLSFLMSLPIIAGAGVYKGMSVMADGGIPAELRSAFAWGMASSAVTGWVAVWGTLRFVRTRTFQPFAVYRWVVGAGVLMLLATGVR